MKRVLLTICSICLVLACLFGLFAVVGGMKDILNIQDYKTKQGEEGRAGIETAIDGIGQLKENEATYVDGAKQYTEGSATLADAEVQLANGYSQYAAGKQQLAEGQAQIDANTQAYNEGKELLSKIEPLMPLLNTYVAFRNGTLAFLPGFSDAQAWFAEKVRPMGADLGLELPEDVTDLPGYIQTMVAEGQAKLKQYEDGLAALESAKKELSLNKLVEEDKARRLLDEKCKDLPLFEARQIQKRLAKANCATIEKKFKVILESIREEMEDEKAEDEKSLEDEISGIITAEDSEEENSDKAQAADDKTKSDEKEDEVKESDGDDDDTSDEEKVEEADGENDDDVEIPDSEKIDESFMTAWIQRAGRITPLR